MKRFLILLIFAFGLFSFSYLFGGHFRPGQTQTRPDVSQEAIVEGAQAVSEVQCKALTQKGARCSRKAKESGFCWQHKNKAQANNVQTATAQPKSVIQKQCEAITKQGSRCKRKVKSGRFCWQHIEKKVNSEKR